MDDADSPHFGIPRLGIPNLQPPRSVVPNLALSPIPRHPAARPAHVGAFLAAHAIDAQTVARAYHLRASNILAAAAVETLWGQHVRGNAYFGVTGGGGTQGGIRFGTHEFDRSGHRYATTRTFRAYANFREAAEGYARLVTTDRRYAHALTVRDDPIRFAEETGRVYATNPRHAANLVGTIRSQRLTEFDVCP